MKKTRESFFGKDQSQKIDKFGFKWKRQVEIFLPEEIKNPVIKQFHYRCDYAEDKTNRLIALVGGQVYSIKETPWSWYDYEGHEPLKLFLQQDPDFRFEGRIKKLFKLSSIYAIATILENPSEVKFVSRLTSFKGFNLGRDCHKFIEGQIDYNFENGMLLSGDHQAVLYGFDGGEILIFGIGDGIERIPYTSGLPIWNRKEHKIPSDMEGLAIYTHKKGEMVLGFWWFFKQRFLWA